MKKRIKHRRPFDFKTIHPNRLMPYDERTLVFAFPNINDRLSYIDELITEFDKLLVR